MGRKTELKKKIQRNINRKKGEKKHREGEERNETRKKVQCSWKEEKTKDGKIEKIK